MGKASRTKGCAFERLVAKQVITAAGKGFSRKDCYRTPMSGGHPYAGESDLVLSEQLMKLFPWCVECKHYKGWKIDGVFKANKAHQDWCKQAAYSSSKDQFKRPPMVVMRGNGGNIYCAARYRDLKAWDHRMGNELLPGLMFRFQDSFWKLSLFSEVMRVLKSRAKRARLKKQKV
jgi:hypothetical protein